MGIELHLLSESNASWLDHCAAEVFDYPVNPHSLAAFLKDPRHVMYLAVDSEQVVGMASGVEYFHPDKPPQLWINEVGVAATHRRQGIGRRLVRALMQEAQQRGCQAAWLGTESDNHAGQACFGSVGGASDRVAFLLYEWQLAHEEEPQS